MTTPEQPDGQGLTRKQLRELQKTGLTPVAPDASGEAPDEALAPAPAHEEPRADPAPPAPEPEAPMAEREPDLPPPPPLPTPALHLPRAADPVNAPPPTPDAQVDLGVSPLTRRQAREQERIRTASVPVITPEVAAAHTASWVPPAQPAPAIPAATAAAAASAADADEVAEPGTAELTLEELFGGIDTDEVDVAEAELIDEAPAPPDEIAPESTGNETAEAERADGEHGPEYVLAAAGAAALREDSVTAEAAASDDRDADRRASEDAPAGEEPEELSSLIESQDDEPEPDARPLLRPEFGSALLAGAAEPEVKLPPSFDDLIARNGSSTGSMSMPNALILSQSPSPMVGPVTATGEVLITGSMALPEVGSRGHAPGVADGKEVDSVLVDGELPAASSPTPIAASAAISTVKGTGEIIRPPAPEKGNRLMLTLAITAGVLALALVGVLILAFVTGAL